MSGRSKRRQTAPHDDGQSRGLPNAIHDPSPIDIDIDNGRSTLPDQLNNVLVSLLTANRSTKTHCCDLTPMIRTDCQVPLNRRRVATPNRNHSCDIKIVRICHTLHSHWHRDVPIRRESKLRPHITAQHERISEYKEISRNTDTPTPNPPSSRMQWLFEEHVQFICRRIGSHPTSRRLNFRGLALA